MLTTVAVILVSLVVVSQGQTTTTASSFTIPTGAALDKIVAGSFANIDSNNDSFVEKWEFDSFIIVADTNNDGCMDLSEYQGFSAGGSTIATKIFKYFDPTNTNCITVDKVYGEFYKMDSDVSYFPGYSFLNWPLDFAGQSQNTLVAGNIPDVLYGPAFPCSLEQIVYDFDSSTVSGCPVEPIMAVKLL